MNVLYPAFYRHVRHPIYHIVKRDGLLAMERDAFATDALDAEGLARLQRGKLARLLRAALAGSRYYREVIDDGAAEAALAGAALCELGLPFLSQDVLRERVDDLLIGGDAPVRFHFEGEGGEPVPFYLDRTDRLRRLALGIRVRRWLGVPIGERQAALSGRKTADREPSASPGRLRSLLARSCVLAADDLSEVRMAEHLSTLRAFGPRLLSGSVSALIRFGEWCEAGGHRITTLRAIVAPADELNEDHRRRISEALHAPVYGRYFRRELGGIAHERPGSEGLLFNADRFLIELLDEQGRPVPPGLPGSLYVTDLDSHCMPLIRYRTGDRAIAAAPISGRTYPALVEVNRSGRLSGK